ncbi:cupredoxin family copper-binding protein [Methylosinus sp. H3A]|uniref:cupredoxin domain-containing protein n=1 Tax=Methylosinus sp. H3A TaxID=2785786 RepID=UPI0018C32785|nr:cupredoxin family copper-binding protein [Methylosinus sp. H3A]MBG0807992.1 cupredoxin family copper-binding protein [Methylosinus sp. H3A]
MSKSAFAIASALAFVGVLIASIAHAGNERTIDIGEFAFAPSEIRVETGARIVFVNHDDTPHNVVDRNGAFRSKALDTGESFSIVFDKPGEITYFCGLHPQMTGKVIVTPRSDRQG